MFYPPSSKTLAVEVSTRDLALGLVINISVILGEGVAPHNVLLVTVVLSCFTIYPSIRKKMNNNNFTKYNLICTVPYVNIFKNPFINVNIRYCIKVSF